MKCEKCVYDIKLCNYKRHNDYCKGEGPRRVQKFLKRGSLEYREKISKSIKSLWEDDEYKNKVKESLRNSIKIKNKKHSEETKKKISESMRGNNNGKHRGDRQSYYKEIRMDSSWEVKVAFYLDSKNIRWEYGQKVFVL